MSNSTRNKVLPEDRDRRQLPLIHQGKNMEKSRDQNRKAEVLPHPESAVCLIGRIRIDGRGRGKEPELPAGRVKGR